MKKTTAKIIDWILQHYCYDEWAELQIIESLAQIEPKSSTNVRLKITKVSEGEPVTDIPF